ncbi:unnamed protein product [Heligmosomoides polygyrus]|uniref:ACT domain-containing protein n=1 Tax=Heligmosomoides polygyrus TaxID=6339 RepID=A0A183FXG9_HELPZ|nr:unnamed protein product [Heligmosomoides polygyrus]
MVHEAVVFLVNVVHGGILLKADKRGVHVPVDGCSAAPLLELCGLLFLTRKAEPRAKEAVVRSRVELGDNGDVCQAILTIKDDVVDLFVELATGYSQVHRSEGGFWNSKALEGFDLFVVVVGC